MSILVYVVAYLSILVFLAAVIKKVVDYIKKPIHLRWELYPVPHEGVRAAYGGSYLEDVNWWQKYKKHSAISGLISDLPAMIPEILFLKGVWEHNRRLWYVTYPFHLGLYFIIVFVTLLFFGAIFQLSDSSVGSQSSVFSAITALTNLFGPIGFILVIFGAVGLFYKRLSNSDLNNYSSFSHFFNLALFIVTMTIAFITWLFVDPNFNMSRTFMASLISFKMTSMTNSLFIIQMLLAFLLMAYIPLTHMSHLFMKYFLYHDIRWGDEANINSPETDAKIGVVLSYPVNWAASHVAGHGKKTWAEVATFNPAAEPEKVKE
mmetsp:Transcript_8022/g.4239  ORF Transcript_8022/g.4239 Transcript_8022/m.4239 type:complete len:319 (+) Transcript_8022:224-1180(+)